MKSGTVKVRSTSHRELIDITRDVKDALQQSTISSGMFYLFNPHTTAGLTINEGADPAVKSDIIQCLNHVVPENLNYRHMEGNSPAHVMALLTGSSLTIMVENNDLLLGTWQKIFFCEYDGPRNRSVYWKCVEDNGK